MTTSAPRASRRALCPGDLALDRLMVRLARVPRVSDSAPAIPLCPITGLPAVRLIQSISSDLLNGLWRASFGVATAGQLGTGGRFGLWGAPCGGSFFYHV